MKYASIHDGVVGEVFEEFVDVEFLGVPTDDNPFPVPTVRSVPLSERYTAEFVAELVAVPADATVSPGDSYDGAKFGPPPQPPAASPLTAAQARDQRDALLAVATLRIDPLKDAVELGEATPAEEALYTAWRQYRIKLNRIEQQAGFPTAVEWPLAPQ